MAGQAVYRKFASKFGAVIASDYLYGANELDVIKKDTVAPLLGDNRVFYELKNITEQMASKAVQDAYEVLNQARIKSGISLTYDFKINGFRDSARLRREDGSRILAYLAKEKKVYDRKTKLAEALEEAVGKKAELLR